MVALEELADHKYVFLVDGSIRGKKSGSFLWDAYGNRKQDHIDVSLLREECSDYEEFLGLIRRSSVVTIPEVTREMQSYPELLGERIAFYNSNERDSPKKARYSRAKKRPSLRKHSQNISELLQELQCVSYQSYQESKRSELKTDKSYELLVEMVRLLSQNIGLKQDTEYLLGKPSKEDTDTDERIAAAAYWLSLNKKRPVVLSSDGDIVRLLGVTPRLMGAGSFLPHNESFRESLENCPFEIYLRREGIIQKALDDYEVYFDCDFEIHNLPFGESDEIKEEMLRLWQQFSKAA